MRYDAKVDANQAGIIKALQKVGVSTEVIGKPLDVLVNARFCCPHCSKEIEGGRTALMEIKNPDGKDQFTVAQVKFIERWPGKIHVVRSEEEAVRAVLGEKALA